MTTFRVTNEAGETLLGPDGRKLEFSGANGWGLAVNGALHKFKKGILVQGPTTDGGQGRYQGPLYLECDPPLEPSGHSKWELHADGSTIPVEA